MRFTAGAGRSVSFWPFPKSNDPASFNLLLRGIRVMNVVTGPKPLNGDHMKSKSESKKRAVRQAEKQPKAAEPTGSKKDQVLALLQEPGGATLACISHTMASMFAEVLVARSLSVPSRLVSRDALSGFQHKRQDESWRGRPGVRATSLHPRCEKSRLTG